MRYNFLLRVRIISGLLVIFALALVVRLYFIQIVEGDEFSLRADRQYASPGQSLYDRGSIFFTDRTGQRIAAAALQAGFTLAITPNTIADPVVLYDALTKVIPLEREKFLSRAQRSDDPYEEIARRLSEEEANQIEALGLEGVVLQKERWRYYPAHTLAAQSVGFVAYDGDVLSGRYGLERYYEDILGRENNDLYVNFFSELFANVGNALRGEDARDGDIVTSIEPSVQGFLDEKVAEVSSKWSAKTVAAVIIDPQTGNILALSVHPSFDLNQFSEVSDVSIFRNPLVENVYELGSIVKPLTLAAGIDAGAITPKTTYVDAGHLELDGKTISNFDGKGRGTVDMQEVLNQSLNTGAVFVMQAMGKETFRNYLLSFGIGEETGIDLPNESAGLIGNLDSPRMLEYATASFGQGIAVTPIAMVRALSALANGGVLVTPHIGSEIRYDSGLSKKVSFKDGRRVLKPESAEEITRMLVRVVDEALAGGTATLPHYSVAAKTGTAQIAREEGGGYYTDRFLHSFFGYFPAYDAKFLAFLMAIEPSGARFASQTLTEPFLDTVKFLVNYYEIPPDR